MCIWCSRFLSVNGSHLLTFKKKFKMKTIFYELFAILALTTSVSRSWARIVNQHEENWEQLFKKEIKSSILKQLNIFESPSNSNFTVANLKSFTERFNDEEQDEKIQLIITAEKGRFNFFLMLPNYWGASKRTITEITKKKRVNNRVKSFNIN